MNQPKMTPERYTKVRALFLQVCELDPLDRSAILDSNCSDDPQLREQVEALLQEDERGSGIVGEEHRRDRFFTSITMPFALAQPQALPCSFGRYRLLRVIGEGGMGAVYEAEQLHPQRTVALKVLRPGLATAAMLRRFEYEAHVLGLLQHSSIAQIFEAGTADQGHGEQPYFVMELVRGRPLLRHAAEHRLTPRQKLELMAKVCDAVQHAHTKGVVHRDLKPSNILVDEAGQPKILDFGVARATDCDIQTTTLHTQVGQLVGTLAYMSPEQAGGNPDEVDTRSDVYSLGVICYELLAGQLPLNLDRKPLHEAVRIIREQEQPKLGTLDRAFRGDIETIVAKAMEKEARHRYQSAAEVSTDLGRCLEGQPIAARRTSFRYVLAKLSVRYRYAFALTSASAAAIIVSFGFTIYWLRQTQAQRDRAHEAEQLAERHLAETTNAHRLAKEEGEKAKTMVRFFEAMVEAAAPDVARGEQVDLRRLLDRTAEGILEEIGKYPDLRTAIAHTIGTTYMRLGIYDRAQVYLKDAASEYERLYGPDHADTLAALGNVASLHLKMSQPKEGLALYQRVLERARASFGPDDERTFVAQNGVGQALERLGRWDEARALAEQTLEQRRRLLGPDHPDVVTAINNLALAYRGLKEYETSDALFEEALELSERVNGSMHPHTMSLLSSKAISLERQGRIQEADAVHQQSLSIGEAIYDARHPSYLNLVNNYGAFLIKQKEYARAENMFRKLLETLTEVLGENHIRTLIAMNALGVTIAEQGRLEEGLELIRGAHDRGAAALGADHPRVKEMQVSLDRLTNDIRQHDIPEASH